MANEPCDSGFKLAQGGERHITGSSSWSTYTSRLIVLYCFQVSGSKQVEELSLVQFRSAGPSCLTTVQISRSVDGASRSTATALSRKPFTIATMMGMRCISVMWVVSGKMANRDGESGCKSPWIWLPFGRNISAMCASRTPSASPCPRGSVG